MPMIIRNNIRYTGGSGSGENTNSVELTQAEYDELLEAGQVNPSIAYFITDSEDNFTAENILFNESESGLTGNSVQGAIESAAKLTSDKFDETKDYTVGDYCIYSNALYKFNKDKSAGAWDSTVVELTSIGSALAFVKIEINELNNAIDTIEDKFKSVQVTPTKTDAVASGSVYYHYHKFGLKRCRVSSLKLAESLENGSSVTIANLPDSSPGITTNVVDCAIVGSNGFTGRLRFNTDGSIALTNLSGAALPTSTALTMTVIFMV